MYYTLRKTRKEQKKTCEDMAKTIGVQASAYSKKERQEIPITIEEAKIISNELDQPIEKIFV